MIDQEMTAPEGLVKKASLVVYLKALLGEQRTIERGKRIHGDFVRLKHPARGRKPLSYLSREVGITIS